MGDKECEDEAKENIGDSTKTMIVSGSTQSYCFGCGMCCIIGLYTLRIFAHTFHTYYTGEEWWIVYGIHGMSVRVCLLCILMEFLWGNNKEGEVLCLWLDCFGFWKGKKVKYREIMRIERCFVWRWIVWVLLILYLILCLIFICLFLKYTRTYSSVFYS